MQAQTRVNEQTPVETLSGTGEFRKDHRAMSIYLRRYVLVCNLLVR